jgi:hypothetical protein
MNREESARSFLSRDPSTAPDGGIPCCHIGRAGSIGVGCWASAPTRSSIMPSWPPAATSGRNVLAPASGEPKPTDAGTVFLRRGPREDEQRRKTPAPRSDEEAACSAQAPDTLWTESQEEKPWPSVRLSSAEMLRFWMDRC